MDRKKYIVEASDDVKKVIALGVTHGGAIWTDTTDIENLEELNSDYINEHFGWLQDDAYQRGLDEAWEAARKIFGSTTDGGYRMGQIREILGKNSLFCATDVIRQCTINEVIEKLKAYEEKQKTDEKIKVGDEVRAEDGTAVFVVTWMSENCICGVDLEGKCYSYEPREVCGKTGRKYSVGISDITRCTDDED